MQLVSAFGGAIMAVSAFEAALKFGSITQTLSGNPASATAMAGLGGGFLGRMGGLGLLGLSGLAAYAIANRDGLFSAATGTPRNTIDNWKAEFEPWNRNRFTLPWETKPAPNEKTSDVFNRMRGLHFTDAPLPPTRLEGSADVRLRVEVAPTSDFTTRVTQELQTSGALRPGDTGVSMSGAAP